MEKYFKTTVVEAIQYTGYNHDEISDFTNKEVLKHPIYSEMVNAKKGNVLHVGDYIVKDGNTFKMERNIDFEKEYKKLK